MIKSGASCSTVPGGSRPRRRRRPSTRRLWRSAPGWAGPTGTGPAGPGRDVSEEALHDTGGAGFHHSGSGGRHGRGGDPPRGGSQLSGGRNASGSSTSLWRTRRPKRRACCLAWPPAAELLVAPAGIDDRYALTKRVRPMTRLDRDGSPRGLRQRARRHAADWPLGCDHRALVMWLIVRVRRKRTWATSSSHKARPSIAGERVPDLYPPGLQVQIRATRRAMSSRGLVSRAATAVRSPSAISSADRAAMPASVASRASSSNSCRPRPASVRPSV